VAGESRGGSLGLSPDGEQQHPDGLTPIFAALNPGYAMLDTVKLHLANCIEH
jgi:hypothetical protein